MYCEGWLGYERFLARAIRRMELPWTEIERALSEAGLGRVSLLCPVLVTQVVLLNVWTLMESIWKPNLIESRTVFPSQDPQRKHICKDAFSTWGLEWWGLGPDIFGVSFFSLLWSWRRIRMREMRVTWGSGGSVIDIKRRVRLVLWT